MSNTAGYVTAGKPRVGGSVYIAHLGTTLPETPSADLSSDYVGLGYISEDGVTNNNTPESDVVKAWGGDTVLNLQTSKDDTFSFKMIEAMNVNVLKAVYGDDNVTDDNGIIKINANSKIPNSYVWIIDMVLKGDVLKRIIIPDASLTELGEISYTDSDAVGYEVTITAVPDASGNTHYELIQQSAEEASYTVTVTATTGGTAFANVANAKSGDTVSLAAIPAEGYEFTSWDSEDVTISATTETVTFTMPAKPVAIEATFTEQ